LTTWSKDSGAVTGAPIKNGSVETLPVTVSNDLLSHPRLFIQVRAQ
jgi:hypothetical protein